MQWIKDWKSFKDFLSIVLTCAPDDFFEEDYLSDEDQLDLEKAYSEVKQGLSYAPLKLKISPLMQEAERLVEEAFAAYRAGDDVHGAHLIQELEEIVNPGRYVEYAARKGIPL